MKWFIAVITAMFFFGVSFDVKSAPLTNSTTVSATTNSNSTQVKSSEKSSTEKIIDLVFKVLLGLVSLVFVILKGLDKLDWIKKERFQKIQKFFDLAFDAVEGFVKSTDNKIDDKLLEFFKRVNELLKENGEKPLTAEEKAAASTFAENKALAKKV